MPGRARWRRAAAVHPTAGWDTTDAFCAQPHAIEQLQRMGAIFGGDLAGRGYIREAHVVQHRLLGQQAEVLEDHGHASAIAAQSGPGEVRYIPAVDDDPTDVGRSSRLMVRTSVDLPAPLMPMMPKRSPSAISKQISFRANAPFAAGAISATARNGLGGRPRRGGRNEHWPAHRRRIRPIDAGSAPGFPAPRLRGRGIALIQILNADHE